MTHKETKASAYEDCLQTALKHYRDEEWLGAHSPLAQPYFLGMTSGAAPHAAQRGRALQKAITQAHDVLWDGALPTNEKTFIEQRPQIHAKGDKYFAWILELHYLHRVIRPSRHSKIRTEHLGMSTAQYHRDRQEAIRLLGENLLRSVHPRLQLERPRPSAGLYGRQTELDNLFAVLNSGKSVNLCGMSGMGKTSLSAALCQRWAGGSFFWYTLRPCLNDRLDGFLFTLAFFLHQRGASDLWQQILADNGQIKNSEIAGSLALHAIKQISPALLLVIDEADLLRSAAFNEQQNGEYARLLGFLERLSGSARLLFVGQRATMTDIQSMELSGINLSALLEWFRALGLDAQTDEVQDLLKYTSGAPRLLTLCLALIQNGSSLTEITEHLKHTPGVGPLMSRLINQMEDVEWQVLTELAVFRQNAPADAWLDRQPALKSLSERGLVQLDLSGGASLLPVWSDLILSELSPEEKNARHLWAAQIRSERGEYTEAAHHYAQAGYPETAIQIWYLNREQAIASGEAAKASAIFNSIAADRLPKDEQVALTLIRAELAHLNADFKKGWRHTEVNWPPSRASVELHRLRGMLRMALSDNPGALREYQTMLDDLSVLTRQQVTALTFRSARFKDEGQYSQAWKELKRAKYLVEAFQGNLFHRQGQYTQAKESYLRALELAGELGDITYLARTYTNIGGLLADHEPEEAYPYLRLALETFEKIGDRIEANLVKMNTAYAMLKSGCYQEALPLAQSAAEFALRIHRPIAADATVNLSEIFLNLENLDEALHWANVSMAQEETAVIPYALNIIGLVYNARGDFTHAETCFLTILKDEASDPEVTARAWRGLGEMYKGQGQDSPAQEAFQKAIELFTQIDMPKEVEKTRASAA